MIDRIVGPLSGIGSLQSAAEKEVSRIRPGGIRGSESAERVAGSKAGSNGAKTSRSASKEPDMAKAAEEFESLLLAQMLRSVREAGGGGWLGSGKDHGSDSTMELAEAQLAKALAQRGALGISRLLAKDVTPESPHVPGVTPSKER